MYKILEGDCIDVLPGLAETLFDLIYIDPPFNTGKKRSRGDKEFNDSFENYLEFLVPRIQIGRDVLSDTGTYILHCDSRESHYIKVEMDKIFGRNRFLNEVIWSYDYGARSKSRWSSKHDVILIYRKGTSYTFNYDEIPRIPYLSPDLVGPEKASRGKTLTDVIWHTIVPTNGKEKTGYPTQKPKGLLDIFVKVHSNPGDHLLDYFAGSGTLGECAVRNGRKLL